MREVSIQESSLFTSVIQYFSSFRERNKLQLWALHIYLSGGGFFYSCSLLCQSVLTYALTWHECGVPHGISCGSEMPTRPLNAEELHKVAEFKHILAILQLIIFFVMVAEKIQMLENKVKKNQIEHSRKDDVIADLKEQLDSMMNDHKLEMEIETISYKAFTKTLTENKDIKWTGPLLVLSESQKAASVLHNKTPKVQEMIVQEALEECKRCEEENHHHKSVKAEFVAPVCDLKEKNTNIDSIVINKETVDLEARTSDFSLLPERKPSTPERRDKYQKESSSTNGIECRNENVYGVSRGQSQCGKTFTLCKESLELAASKNPLSLHQSQDKNVKKLSMPYVTQVESIKIQKIIAKYSSAKIKSNDSILMKSGESDYSAAATKTNDLFPHALAKSGLSHSSSSSLSTNGESLVLIDEVLSQSDVTEEKGRLLDLAHVNVKKSSNIMEENKQVPDLEYQNALETVERKTFCIDKNNKLKDPVYQVVFANATNNTTVAEKHKPVTDLACQTTILNSTIETERRKILIDLANNTASCNVENVATGREDKYQILESNFQNITNVAGKNEKVLDSPNQPGVKNSTECGKIRAEKEQAVNSVYLTFFQNATKSPDINYHVIALDRMNKRVVSPLVDGHLTTGLKVKDRCPTISKDSNLSLENTFNNLNDTQTSIVESSQGLQNSFNGNLQLSAEGSSPTPCLCNGPPSGHMVNCVMCESNFHAACVMSESNNLNQGRERIRVVKGVKEADGRGGRDLRMEGEVRTIPESEEGKLRRVDKLEQRVSEILKAEGAEANKNGSTRSKERMEQGDGVQGANRVDPGTMSADSGAGLRENLDSKMVIVSFDEGCGPKIDGRDVVSCEREALAEQEIEEFDCLSHLEECFDGEEEPMEIATFATPSFILQQQETAAMGGNVQEQLAPQNSPLESELEEFDLPNFVLDKEEKENKDDILSKSVIRAEFHLSVDVQEEKNKLQTTHPSRKIYRKTSFLELNFKAMGKLQGPYLAQ
ncbi:hypothetical protein KI387_007893 [Taxus chinensis]|uniref:Uncharacterized protein n=1 Tax=Taxus chinensis TaxID=29808 RepID=A0AA38GTZ4_TAXCH|nr:hypothetical protein KI387_007893 [Taxus chinensis]